MINEHYIPQAVILANGEYPAHELPLRLLAEAQFVVCCDGAANEYISRGHTPDVIIGDGDSLLPEYKKRFSSIILQISDQETNDQTKAVHYLQSKGIRKIAIVGATDYGTFIPVSDTQSFASHPGQQVSIINFGAEGLKGEGLFYPLSDFSNWWQGTLNEATADEFTIHCTGEYLVFLAY